MTFAPLQRLALFRRRRSARACDIAPFSTSARQRDARLGRTRRPHRQQDRRVRRERRLEAVRAGKERGRVHVRPHAQQHDTDSGRFGADLLGQLVEPRLGLARRAGTSAGAGPLPPCPTSSRSRSSRVFERSLSSGTQRSSVSITSTRPQSSSTAQRSSKTGPGEVPPGTAKVDPLVRARARRAVPPRAVREIASPASRGRHIR